jgi:hypothetical protein
MPTPTPIAAAVSPRAQRTLAGATVSVRLADGWTLRRSGRRLFVRGAGERVVISVAARHGRSLAELGRDTRAALRPRGPVPLRRARVGGHAAMRVTARGREVTALVLGRRRWVIARDAGGGPARRVARSVRIGAA